MKKKLIFLIIGIFLILTIGFITSYVFNSDSKLTRVYTKPVCDSEIGMNIENKICDENTPTELQTDFDMDEHTGLLRIDSGSIERSAKLNN